MFENLAAIGTPPQPGIAAQTRRGRDIQNEQALEPCEVAIAQFVRVCSTSFGWEVRRNARGLYNCAGHIFLNRRASIYIEEEYLKILKDDGYELVANHNLAEVGDIAVYKLSGKIVHVGTIVLLEKVHPSSREVMITVLSKIGDTGGEVVHKIMNYPLFDVVELWRPI